MGHKAVMNRPLSLSLSRIPWLRRLAVFLAIGIGLSAAPFAQAGEKPDLAKLIRQLGRDEFDEREKAQHSLEALGEDDLPTLRAAAKKTTDAEVRRRLEAVIASIELRSTKDPYVFIEKVGGRVVTVEDNKPVKAGEAGSKELAVGLSDTKFGDADLHRLKELGKVAYLTLAGTKVTDRGISVLQSLSDLRSLHLGRTALTDAGLVHLKELKNLECLSLKGTKLKGKGLDHLKDLKELYNLNLDGCEVTDDALKHVVALKRLRILSLARTKITDAGLTHLPELPDLARLMLEETAVTDAGLTHLARVKKLRDVYLTGTHVTARGVTELQKANSKLQIEK
jgi:hypothetical protein